MFFRTYGTKRIDKNYRYTESELDLLWKQFEQNKPGNCLWASPVKGRNTWEKWCRNNFYHEDSLNVHADFVLHISAKVLCIRNLSEAKRAARRYGFFKDGEFYFDWKRIRQDYDAVFVSLSGLAPETSDFKNTITEYFNLNAWDVDSLVVFNLKKVVVLK